MWPRLFWMKAPLKSLKSLKKYRIFFFEDSLVGFCPYSMSRTLSQCIKKPKP